MATQINYPKIHNKSDLEKIYKKAVTDISKQEKISHAAQKAAIKSSLTEVNLMAKNMKVDLNEVTSKNLPKREAAAKQYKTERLPNMEPLKGHNPVIFAPFDIAFQSNVSADVAAWANNYLLDRQTGQSASSVGALSGGTARSVTNIGEWFSNPSAGAAYVSAQATISGNAFASASFGYSDVYVQLHLYVYSLTQPPFQLVTNIWSSAGMFNFGHRNFNREVHTVSGVIPVQRNTPYLILAIPYLSAGAGGEAAAQANISMSIAPIAMTPI